MLTVTAATADFLTSASDTVRFTSLPFTSVEMYLPSPLIPNVSSLRLIEPVLVATSPVNFNAVAPVTAFNCSSVAARPFVAKSAPVTVVLDKPVISFVVPFTVTPPILAVLPVIVPVAPSSVTGLAPPVVIVLFTPSTTAVPTVALPAIPSIITALVPVPRVTLSLSFTS